MPEQCLREYLQWDVDLEALYGQWARADENFAAVAGHYAGVRILKQDPVENVFAFVCSSNNNIPRWMSTPFFLFFGGGYSLNPIVPFSRFGF